MTDEKKKEQTKKPVTLEQRLQELMTERAKIIQQIKRHEKELNDLITLRVRKEGAIEEKQNELNTKLEEEKK